LFELPEVHRVLEEHRVTLDKFSDSLSKRSIYADDEVDLATSDTNVRGVLNKIARDSEHKMWDIGWRDEKKTILIAGF